MINLKIINLSALKERQCILKQTLTKQNKICNTHFNLHLSIAQWQAAVFVNLLSK